MKRIIINLSIVSLLFLGIPLMAQPPEPGGEPGAAPPLGGSAPIEGGMGFMLVMAAAYAAKKVVAYRKSEQ